MVGTVTDILLGPVWDIQKFTLSNVKLLIILHQLMFTVDSGKDGSQMSSGQWTVKVHVPFPISNHDAATTQVL